MKPDDEICLCFHISQRKIVNYLKRENPPVASLISECLGAGTGCGWCIPALRKLHELHQEGDLPTLNTDADTYAKNRESYRENRKQLKSEPESEQEPETQSEHD